MQGLEFRKVAEGLRGGDLPFRRTSVSRSFYALLNHMKDKWRILGWDKKYVKDVNHKNLIEDLRNSETYNNISKYLQILRKNRLDADYNMHINIDQNMKSSKICEKMIAKVDVAVQEFDSIDHSAGRDEIRARRKRIGRVPLP